MFRKQFRDSLVVVAFCAVGVFGTGCSAGVSFVTLLSFVIHQSASPCAY